MNEMKDLLDVLLKGIWILVGLLIIISVFINGFG